MRSLYTSTALVLFFAGTLSAGESDKAAIEIVDKAVAALGGADKLSKAKGHTWKVKGEMSMGGMSMKYDGGYTFVGPEKFRFDIDMNAGGMEIKLTAATNGKVAWEQMAPMLREMAKEKQEEFHHNVYVINLSQISPLKDKAYTLTSLEERKFDGQTLVGIKVSRDGRRDVSMYFDKQSGLLIRTTTKVNDEFTQKEVVQESVMSGYRDKGGVKIFDKLTILRDGKPFVVEEMSEQKMLDKVDEKLFAKPEK